MNSARYKPRCKAYHYSPPLQGIVVYCKYWITTLRIISTNRPFARWHHFTLYYYNQNPSGFCFLVLIRAFVIQTSLGLQNLNMKGKTKRILVVVVKWRHRANGLNSYSTCQLSTSVSINSSSEWKFKNFSFRVW